MIGYIFWLLGLIGCYLILRRMFQIEMTQQKILSGHKLIAETEEKVLKSHSELLAVLHSIIPYLHKAKEQPKPVIKGIVKRRPNVYQRTPEFKKKMSELTKARWEKKRAQGSIKIPEPTLKSGAIPSSAALIQETING